MVIRALSYDSPLIQAYKIHRTFTSKTGALKWPEFKSDSSYSIMLGNFMSLLSSTEYSFEIIVFKIMSHEYE